MKNIRKILPIFYLFLILFFLVSNSFAAELPENLLKIKSYNHDLAQSTLKTVSFTFAFLAGILTILSPCILPLLPAYFSIAFREKKNITKMTSIFFLGFSSIFLGFGIVASVIGSMTILALKSDWLVYLSSSILIIMGILIFFGKGFSSNLTNKLSSGNNPKSVFFNGVLFALGWSACVGPILAGILSIAVVLGNLYSALYLMFFYSLGILVPLFILSILHDKYDLSKKSWIKGKLITIDFFGNKIKLQTTNIISGSLLSLVGILFILNNGTGLVNGFSYYITKPYFFIFQNFLMNWTYSFYLGLGVLSLFLFFLYKSLMKK